MTADIGEPDSPGPDRGKRGAAQHPLVIIITGEEGLEHGYADRYRADGVFEYFGEGQVGDMRLRAGNRAIAEHSVQGKGLLLFRKTSEGLRFEGEMVCEGSRGADGETYNAKLKSIMRTIEPNGSART